MAGTQTPPGAPGHPPQRRSPGWSSVSATSILVGAGKRGYATTRDIHAEGRDESDAEIVIIPANAVAAVDPTARGRSRP
ncbi:hypothetical protein [Streptomyces sp. NBC_01235]|uniref:hypothetical protein n=1 Tax=Streptomyces sp. NBC_01235 TaxID=2903788 RepID=UPI002E144B5D|nr:hypothetical protein OG289_29390 [Streptomyces sp. NBC_01235]